MVVVKESQIIQVNEYMWISEERTTNPNERPLIKIGLTDNFQRDMGPLEFIRVLPEGRFVSRGYPFGSVESGRKIKLLRAPLTGIIVKINEEIIKDPEIINKDPYGRGWIILFEPILYEDEIREVKNRKINSNDGGEVNEH